MEASVCVMKDLTWWECSVCVRVLCWVIDVTAVPIDLTPNGNMANADANKAIPSMAPNA